MTKANKTIKPTVEPTVEPIVELVRVELSTEDNVDNYDALLNNLIVSGTAMIKNNDSVTKDIVSVFDNYVLPLKAKVNAGTLNKVDYITELTELYKTKITNLLVNGFNTIYSNNSVEGMTPSQWKKVNLATYNAYVTQAKRIGNKHLKIDNANWTMVSVMEEKDKNAWTGTVKFYSKPTKTQSPDNRTTEEKAAAAIEEAAAAEKAVLKDIIENLATITITGQVIADLITAHGGSFDGKDTKLILAATFKECPITEKLVEDNICSAKQKAILRNAETANIVTKKPTKTELEQKAEKAELAAFRKLTKAKSFNALNAKVNAAVAAA